MAQLSWQPGLCFERSFFGWGAAPVQIWLLWAASKPIPGLPEACGRELGILLLVSSKNVDPFLWAYPSLSLDLALLTLLRSKVLEWLTLLA